MTVFRAPQATSDVPRFPLLWPPERLRTPFHELKPARWGYGWATVINDLRVECELAKIGDWALSTGRSGSSVWEDRGAVLWFMQQIDGVWAMSYCASDSFRNGNENVKAIALTIQRLRLVADYGCYSVSAAMRGAAYKALPAPAAAKRTWWDVLEVSPAAPRAVVEAAYRALARLRHPDMPSGSPGAFAELGEAIAEARKACRDY